MEVTQRFECLTCGATHEGSTPPEERKCCEKPNLKLLAITVDPEIDYQVELGKCYEDIIEILRYYLDMPEEHYKFIAIWIIGTYFHQSFSSFPFLFFNAMRGSGKTRALLLISHLSAGGDGSVLNDVTEAVLFRTLPGTTICIDELEDIKSKEKSTLRQLLNAAYKRGVKVKRMKKIKDSKGENQVAEEFEPYMPIVMANIRGLDVVLEDRAFTIILDKSHNPLKTKKVEDFDENPKIKQIKRTLEQSSVVCVMSLRKKTYKTAWNNYIESVYNDTNNNNNIYIYTTQTTTHDTKLTQKELELFNKIDEAGIDGRNFELLFPLLIVANELSDDTFHEILKIGSGLIDEKKKEESSESIDVSLIEYISTMEEQTRFSYLPLKSVLSGFRNYLGETDVEDTWLNAKWLGRALKRLNMMSDKRRVAGGREVILNIDKAKHQMGKNK